MSKNLKKISIASSTEKKIILDLKMSSHSEMFDAILYIFFQSKNSYDSCDPAMNNQLEILKYAHENKYPLDTCTKASLYDSCDPAMNSHLEILKYAYEKFSKSTQNHNEPNKFLSKSKI
jgi:hypothetical protein